MLDLDLIELETIDFKLKGKIINMIYPSQKVLRKYQLLGTIQETEKQEKEFYKTICEMINNNTNDIKFKVSELEELNLKTLKTLMEYIIECLNETKKK